MRAFFVFLYLTVNLIAFKVLGSEIRFQKKIDKLLGQVNLNSYSEESLRDLLALRWEKKGSPEGLINLNKLIDKAVALSYLGVPADVLITGIFGDSYFIKEKSIICKNHFHELCIQPKILEQYSSSELMKIVENNFDVFDRNPNLFIWLQDRVEPEQLKEINKKKKNMAFDLVLAKNTKEKELTFKIFKTKMRNKKMALKYCNNPNYRNFYKKHKYDFLLEICSKVSKPPKFN